MEFVDLVQVGKNASQLSRVQHGSHFLEKNLVQNPQSPQVGYLGGEQLWSERDKVSNPNIKEPPLLCVLLFFSTRTIYDGLTIHLLRTEHGKKLGWNSVLPVLTLTRFLLQSHTVRQQGQGRFYTPAQPHMLTQKHRKGDGPISLSTDGGRCPTFEAGKFFKWKGSQHSLFICTSAQLLGLTDITWCGHDAWTHLRLDRGVYGGVGFSRDLSLREWRERWYEEKPTALRGHVWGALDVHIWGQNLTHTNSSLSGGWKSISTQIWRNFSKSEESGLRSPTPWDLTVLSY